MWVCFHLHIIGLKSVKFVRPKRGLALFMSVSDLYIRTINLPIQLQVICGPILGIYKSLTYNVKRGNVKRLSEKRFSHCAVLSHSRFHGAWSRGHKAMSTVQLCTWSPNKLWRSNSIFYLWAWRISWGYSPLSDVSCLNLGLKRPVLFVTSFNGTCIAP